ncbi:IclR family transcriptional regulator [Mangrovactinospora gilvigrisea]|uniref:IclR family transcriptional regulator n=1 Tax=Mangrovactinospora gilvigrisea TaxID=1428644 RepID=A0A1J7C066_9ACTN|nr:IclR family transcriptional regulator [Mangrovactinospora gilvigrisea]OIV39121.1 IclR family transcriptional regulator [Mangrovactinospora gilvigrisea]
MSQSVGRALELLIRLGEGPGTLDGLAAGLDVHKTTVLRLLRTLEEQRFVYRDQQHRYHLGSRSFELAGAALEQREIRATAAPFLARLGEATGQTVHLGVREGGEVVYLDKYDARTPIRMYSRIGRPMPQHCTAIGKVLLADLPEKERRAAAEALDYRRFTEHTVTGPAAFLAELERTARRGWGLDDGEHETFMTCIGAPVRDATGAVAAAVSLSVPDVVLGREDVLALLPQLLETAGEISRAAGYR